VRLIYKRVRWLIGLDVIDYQKFPIDNKSKQFHQVTNEFPGTCRLGPSPVNHYSHHDFPTPTFIAVMKTFQVNVNGDVQSVNDIKKIGVRIQPIFQNPR
jgi:hypothetical protein